jgi:hypothetical protein
MVNLTISLPEATVKKLRKAVRVHYGGKKGALSGLIKEALEEHIASAETVRPAAHFRAYDGDNQVAEAPNLDQLALLLRERRIDPRQVRIVSSTALRQVVRAGLPGKRT